MKGLGDNQYVTFSPDGSRLASGKSSGQIEIWKLVNGNFEKQKTVNKEQPYSIAFNPDGNVLAVATLNNVYLIDTITGEEINRIPHKGIVYSVSFSADGKTLATASLKMIQLWDVSNLQSLRTSELVNTACSRLIENFNSQEWTALFGQEEYHPLCEKLRAP